MMNLRQNVHRYYRSVKESVSHCTMSRSLYKLGHSSAWYADCKRYEKADLSEETKS